MQRTNEKEKRTNGNANEEEKEVIIFIASDGLVYETDGSKTWPISVVSDPSTWDMPHVYPKKRKKRKKGFDREITRVKDSYDRNRPTYTLHKQLKNAQYRTGR